MRVRGGRGHSASSTHLIEEYARHNGRADLLRERLDGRPENELRAGR